jgi:hypothetical protein
VRSIDLPKFFDCVSHEIARKALGDLVVDANQQQKIHTRAIEIFEAYLESYTFAGTVLR